MTGRTAQVFGIPDRGEIREGAFADLVLCDAETVRDTATFADPKRCAEGILQTWVNGQSSYVQGEGVTGERAGRLVERAPAQ
jgi:N-acyl-D-amino-acid deacylase